MTFDDCHQTMDWADSLGQESQGEISEYRHDSRCEKRFLKTVRQRYRPAKSYAIFIKKLYDNFLKLQMESLFKTGKTLYFSDLAQELDIDLKTAVKMAKTLMREGKIKIDDGTR